MQLNNGTPGGKSAVLDERADIGIVRDRSDAYGCSIRNSQNSNASGLKSLERKPIRCPDDIAPFIYSKTIMRVTTLTAPPHIDHQHPKATFVMERDGQIDKAAGKLGRGTRILPGDKDDGPLALCVRDVPAGNLCIPATGGKADLLVIQAVRGRVIVGGKFP